MDGRDLAAGFLPLATPTGEPPALGAAATSEPLALGAAATSKPLAPLTEASAEGVDAGEPLPLPVPAFAAGLPPLPTSVNPSSDAGDFGEPVPSLGIATTVACSVLVHAKLARGLQAAIDLAGRRSTSDATQKAKLEGLV